MSETYVAKEIAEFGGTAADVKVVAMIMSALNTGKQLASVMPAIKEIREAIAERTTIEATRAIVEYRKALMSPVVDITPAEPNGKEIEPLHIAEAKAAGEVFAKQDAMVECKAVDEKSNPECDCPFCVAHRSQVARQDKSFDVVN